VLPNFSLLEAQFSASLLLIIIAQSFIGNTKTFFPLVNLKNLKFRLNFQKFNVHFVVTVKRRFKVALDELGATFLKM